MAMSVQTQKSHIDNLKGVFDGKHSREMRGKLGEFVQKPVFTLGKNFVGKTGKEEVSRAREGRFRCGQDKASLLPELSGRDTCLPAAHPHSRYSRSPPATARPRRGPPPYHPALSGHGGLAGCLPTGSICACALGSA